MLTDEEVAALLKNKDFPPLKNDNILKAAKGEVPDRLPIWIMRQAGRFLPEFQDFRKKHSFFEICQSPKLACEVTLMPIRRYDLDASIIFSDILVIPQALGMEVVMVPEKGPVMTEPLVPGTLDKLQWNGALERLTYVGQAITVTRHKLEGKVPLFGFSAAPWTLMVYMVEGSGTKTASKAKKWLYAKESIARQLIANLRDIIIDYLVMQVEHGAQMLQLFESSAEHLNLEMYEKFMPETWKEIREGVLNKLKAKNIPEVPMVLFVKGGQHLMSLQVKSGYDVLGVDWVTDPQLIKNYGKDITLQGNLDPCALYSSKEDLIKYINKMIKSFGYKKYIVNLGHGIYPDTPTEAVEWFIEAVHAHVPK